MKSKVEVIFREHSANFNVGDRAWVKPGYLRNYLAPKGKAILVTPAAVLEFEKIRAALEEKAAVLIREARMRAEQLSGVSIQLSARVRGEGKLFGSIGVREIANALTQRGILFEKREINLPHPLRELGEYDVSLHISKDIIATIKVVIVSEND